MTLTPTNDEILTRLTDDAMARYERMQEAGMDHDLAIIDATLDAIDGHEEMLRQLSLTEQVAFMDDVSAVYDLNDAFEDSQVRDAVYTDDWHDVIDSLFYEITMSAIMAANGWAENHQ